MNNEVLKFLKVELGWNLNNIKSINKIGGLSNNNYKVTYDINNYFVRLCPHTYLHTDRKCEKDILHMLSHYELTSKCIYYSITTGNMVSTWINGHSPLVDEYLTEDFISLLMIRLKGMHKLKYPKKFNPFSHIRARLKLCTEAKLWLPTYLDKLLAKFDYLEASLTSNETLGLCHNDLNFSNMILSENTLFFIDFEYACMGDIFWDLATASWFLDIPQRKFLLQQYFGYYREEDYGKLVDYLFIVKLYNATWSLLKSKDSTSDYDYLNGAKTIFKEMQAFNKNI